MNKEQRNLLIAKRGHPMTWMRYHRYADMVRYMEFLAFSYPNRVQILTIGHTTNGLPLRVIKFFSKASDKIDEKETEKPVIWIDGGMHGREWITSSVVLYIARQLIENYNKHKEMADSAVWYFLPVANPDGYEYTHSRDRLWKKTRSVHESSNSNLIKKLLFGSCEGVDLNQNFDYHWGENLSASVDPCQDGYPGPGPLSEPEAQAISDFIMLNKNRIKMFVTLHSYSQKWLIPWSYTLKKAADYSELERFAKKAAKAIALVFGSHYDVGSSSSLMYPTSGTAEDWAKGAAEIKYSYSIMLRDRGSFGFLLPAAQIVPTAKEIFVAMKVLAKMMTEKKRH
ncbi:hypothetical protein RUM43_003723 [Polyplax serrata]|uniref:Peptidase M14 domain-containing protein n=1 Tax=Polyplax serrata TaxID=468196 RepID=A0AAN8S5Q4_POLSC